MRPLLAVSNAIDLLNEKLGGICNWLVLAAVVVSAANAMIRYAFGYSSNAWLELQWYMFAVFVMFGASYTFKKNEHVRVEIMYLMLSERGQLWLDMIGSRASVVAEPPGQPGHGRGAARWSASDPRACRDTGGASPPLGALGRVRRREPRQLGISAFT